VKGHDIPRPSIPNKRGGVSAISTMMQPLQFVTGGYDHIVHLWQFKADLSAAASRPLAIKHTSLIQSLLAIRDTSHKLISTGADCNVNVWDLASERTVASLKISNSVYHAHQATSPFCTLLEVSPVARTHIVQRFPRSSHML
jgi:WD40 repeat protein